jgi:hypothetical protein
LTNRISHSRETIVRTFLVTACITAFAFATGAAQRKPSDVPVDFSTSVNFVGPMGAAATNLMIHIDRYTADSDRTTLVDALKQKGYDGFLPALRQAPVVGYIQVKDQKWDVRWAHQQTADLRQTVTIATDQPIYFVGGGRPDAKPRAGFDMAVIRLDVDTIGMGTGSLAPAARVKPTADGQGVQVDDYAGEPVEITSVKRIH